MSLKQLLDGIRTHPYIVSRRPRKSFNPSSASVEVKDGDGFKVIGTCLRRLYYEHNDTRPDGEFILSARMSRILEMGDIYARLFIEDFKKLGIFIAEEVSFYNKKYDISGRIDALIKDPYTSPRLPERPSAQDVIGVEFKTVGGYQGVKGPVISTRDTPLMVKMDNLLQTMLYLDEYKKYGVKKWLLFYIDRALGASEDNPKHYEIHTIELTEDGSPIITNDSGTSTFNYLKVQHIYDRYDSLRKSLDAGALPKRDFSLQYSNKKIESLFQQDLLDKTTTEKLTKKLKKDTKLFSKEEPVLEMGDWQCAKCPFMNTCYSDNPGLIIAAENKKAVLTIEAEDIL